MRPSVKTLRSPRSTLNRDNVEVELKANYVITERRNKYSLFLRMCIELTTIAYAVRRCTTDINIFSNFISHFYK